MADVPLSVQIATAISCVGSFFTLSTYFLFPDLRTPSQLFAIWLAIGSLGYSAFTFLPVIYRDDLACKIYGCISTYFTLVSLFSTVVVADCMRRIFMSRHSQSQENTTIQVKKEFYFFVFGLPLTFVWLPATTNSFGINDHDIFCWIKTDSSNQAHNDIGFMWILLTFYLPFFCGICFNSFVYATVVCWVFEWKRQNIVEADRFMAIVDRIKWYPIILVACYAVPFIHRGLELGSDDFRHHHLVVIVGSITLKLQGFFDAVAYSATPQVLKKWQTLLSTSLIPTIEWASFSSRTSFIEALSSDKLLYGSPSSTSSPKVKNEVSSNSNSRGSSYFSYAQDENDIP